MEKVLIFKKPDYELYAEHEEKDGLHMIRLTTVWPTMRDPRPKTLLLLHLNKDSMQLLSEVLDLEDALQEQLQTAQETLNSK